MPLNIKSDVRSPASYAQAVVAELKRCYTALKRAQAQLASDRYDTIVDLPKSHYQLQIAIADAQASGLMSKILPIIIEQLPEDTTTQEINAFVTAHGNLSSDVEANANVFLHSYSATKQLEFVTPVAAGVKTAINNRIAAALATVVE